MTPPARIRLESSCDSGRADLRIAIPPVNVFGAATPSELARQIALARDARVLVLTGLPRAFSTGVEPTGYSPGTMIWRAL